MGIHYIKCPRCDLNWIPDTEKYCDVCKADLHIGTNVTLLGDEVDDDDSQLICPICKVNYIEEGEEMCMQCRADRREQELSEEKEKWDSGLGGDEESMDESGEIVEWDDSSLVSPDDEEILEEVELDDEENEEESEQEEADGYNDADIDEMFLDDDDEFTDEELEGEDDGEDEDDDSDF